MHKYIKNAKNKNKTYNMHKKQSRFLNIKSIDNCKQIYYDCFKLISANAIMYMLEIGPVFLPTIVKS